MVDMLRKDIEKFKQIIPEPRLKITTKNGFEEKRVKVAVNEKETTIVNVTMQTS